MYYRKWVEFVLAMFVILVMCKVAFATDAVYDRYRPNEVVGWSVYAADDDLSAAATLLTELDTTYAQLAAEEAIEVLSAAAGDTTQTVTVTGIDSNGNKCSESFALAGTTVQTSSTTFRYVDQASVDIECAGAITVRKKTGDTLIISIPIGSLKAQVSQHFNGERRSLITYWAVGVDTTAANVTFQLRRYDDADSLDSGDGFEVLDSIFIDAAATSPYNVSRSYAQPILVPKGSWICVMGNGSADNGSGYAILQGVDIK